MWPATRLPDTDTAAVPVRGSTATVAIVRTPSRIVRRPKMGFLAELTRANSVRERPCGARRMTLTVRRVAKRRARWGADGERLAAATLPGHHGAKPLRACALAGAGVSANAQAHRERTSAT
jgi:hypothetical protein